MPRGLLVALLLSATAGPTAGPLAAQRAPLFLEPTHWSAEALRRLGTLGLLPPAADPATAPLTRRHVQAVLAAALERAETGGDAAATALIDGYLELLAGESAGRALPAVMRVSAGWQSASGEARGGDGYFHEEDWQGAQPLPDLDSPLVLLEAGAHLQPWLAAAFSAGRTEEDWAIPAWTVALAAGPLDVWGGRRRMHHGIGRGGAAVLGSGTGPDAELAGRMLHTFEGVGLHVREPFRLPGFLRFLGPIRIEAAGGRLARNGDIERPYVAFGRLTGHPFSPRFTLGVNRGAIFGGEGNAVTGGRLLGLLIGLHGGAGGEFENQVFSALVRYRPPLGRLAAEIYAEIGMDDTAGAIRDMPAVIAGLDAVVPGLPALSAGLERTSYPASCCGNPIWYRSVFFRGSWADEGRLFAHPLGGHGTEWLAHAALDLPQHGLLVRGRLLRRHRGEENLFAPGRTGTSHGAAIALEYGARTGTRLLLGAAVEDGATWTRHRLDVRVTHWFGLR